MKTLFIALLESSLVFIPGDTADPHADPLLQYFHLETTPKEVDGLVHHIMASLAAGASTRFRGALEEAGNTLYRNLVPKEIRTQLNRYEGPLLICSFNTSIPWELCHDGSDFWGLKYDIGRQTTSRVARQARSQRRRAGKGWHLLVVGTDPHGNLPQAVSEAQAVYDYLKVGSAPGARLRTKTASFGEVASGLQSEELDIFHFCGHLDVQGHEPQLALEGGPGLSRNAIKRSLRGHPLVYLNCCGGDDESRSALAMAQAFMQARASGVVASIAPRVLDREAPEFAISFYRHLVGAGASHGAAMRLARLDMREKYPDSPVWASFVLYGLPVIALGREDVRPAGDAAGSIFDSSGAPIPEAWSVEAISVLANARGLANKGSSGQAEVHHLASALVGSPGFAALAQVGRDHGAARDVLQRIVSDVAAWAGHPGTPAKARGSTRRQHLSGAVVAICSRAAHRAAPLPIEAVHLLRATLEDGAASGLQGVFELDPADRIVLAGSRATDSQRGTAAPVREIREATPALRDALRRCPPGSALSDWMHGCLRLGGGAEAARASVEAALAAPESGAGRARLLRLRGDLQLAAGETWAAIGTYEALTGADDPRELQFARFGIGLAHLVRGDVDEGSRWLSQVQDAGEGGVLRSYGAGLLAAAKREYPVAARLLGEVAEAWPWVAGARLRLGECYLAMGRAGDACHLLESCRDAASDSRLLELKLLQSRLRAGNLGAVACELRDLEGLPAAGDGSGEHWRQTALVARDYLIRMDELESALRFHVMAMTGAEPDAAANAMHGYLEYEIARSRIASENGVSAESAARLKHAGLLVPGAAGAGAVVAFLATGLPEEADRFHRRHAQGMDPAFSHLYSVLVNGVEIAEGARAQSLGDLLTTRRMCAGFSSGDLEVSAPNLNRFLAILASDTLDRAAVGQRDWLEYSLVAMAFRLQGAAFGRMFYALEGLPRGGSGWRRLHFALDLWDTVDKVGDDMEDHFGRLQAAAVGDPIGLRLLEVLSCYQAARRIAESGFDYEAGSRAAMQLLAARFPDRAAEYIGVRDFAAATLAGIVVGESEGEEILRALARDDDPRALHRLAARDCALAEAAALNHDFTGAAARYRSGIASWRRLLDLDDFWIAMATKLRSAPYRSKYEYDDGVVARVRAHWPALLGAWIGATIAQAERCGEREAQRQLADLVAQMHAFDPARDSLGPGPAEDSRESGLPFLENAFAMLQLASTTRTRDAIERRTRDLNGALAGAGGSLAIRRHGADLILDLEKVARAREALLTPEGRVIAELLEPEPAPMPWLGYPGDAMGWCGGTRLRTEVQAILDDHPEFDSCRFLAANLPAMKCPDLPPDPLAALVPVHGAVPVGVQHLLPLQ